MSEAPFLSIIVPFHNSAAKCAPLLKTLGRVTSGEDVEIILVDDGSTDSTPAILRDFADRHPLPVQVIQQSHSGPGAARNAGMDAASGEYLWFVDSDDDIDLGTIGDAKSHGADWPDVILWEWDHPSIRRAMPEGPGDRDTRPPRPDQFDPIVANCYSRAFLQRAAIRFPEYCLFEATPIEAFVLPILVRSWVKSGFTAYRAETEGPSVTRTEGRIGPGFFDRLVTVRLGMAFACSQQLTPSERDEYESAFIRLFLWYSIALSPLPGRSWLRALRILRQYRDEAVRFEIDRDPLSLFPGRARTRAVVRLLWWLSSLMPSQQRYFDRMRKMAWDREIEWVSPVSADRLRHLPTGADEGSFPAAPADS